MYSSEAITATLVLGHFLHEDITIEEHLAIMKKMVLGSTKLSTAAQYIHLDQSVICHYIATVYTDEFAKVGLVHELTIKELT
eukprot:m51a1_g12037 hypothetical protein (82) ;mRNA; r:18651-18896